MNCKSMPILKFQIERMSEAINTCLGTHYSELGDAIESEVLKAVECYDLEDKVTRIVHKQITLEIQKYFEYGDGNVAIRDIIRKSFAADSEESA